MDKSKNVRGAQAPSPGRKIKRETHRKMRKRASKEAQNDRKK
jgi:hypothetical protein